MFVFTIFHFFKVLVILATCKNHYFLFRSHEDVFYNEFEIFVLL